MLMFDDRCNPMTAKKGGRKELKQQKRENECNTVCCQADRGFVHSPTWSCGASLEVLRAPFHVGGAVLWQKAHSV